MRTLVVAAALVPLSAVFAAQTRPVTTVREVTDVMHGNTIVDPYRWLESGTARTRARRSTSRRDTRGASSTGFRSATSSGRDWRISSERR